MPRFFQDWPRWVGACVLALGVQFVFFQTLSFAAPIMDAVKLGKALPPIVGGTTATAVTTCKYIVSDTYSGPHPNAPSSYSSSPYSTEANGQVDNTWGYAILDTVLMPTPPLTDSNNNLNLSFRGGSWSSTSALNGTWTASTASPLSTPVPCTGTYQVFFTLQLQATYYGGNQFDPMHPQNPVFTWPAATITVYPCVQTKDAKPTLVYGSLLVNGVCPGTGPYFKFNPVCNGGNYCSVVTFPFTATVHLNAGQVVGPPAIHSSAPVAVTGGEFMVIYEGP